LRRNQTRSRGKNATFGLNSRTHNGLRREKFFEEILAACRHAENGVFTGKIGSFRVCGKLCAAVKVGAEVGEVVSGQWSVRKKLVEVFE
jgi:hypothetical protein